MEQDGALCPPVLLLCVLLWLAGVVRGGGGGACWRLRCLCAGVVLCVNPLLNLDD